MVTLGAVLGGFLVIFALVIIFLTRREMQGRPTFQPITKRPGHTLGGGGGGSSTTASRTADEVSDIGVKTDPLERL